ncbi:MAG: hypothetical protein ACRC2B_16375 [Rubrivivax sp.]
MKAQQLAFWGRAVAAWLLIAAVETVHGVARGLWLVPVFGEVAAQRLGFAVASALVVAVAWLTSRWLDASTRAAQLKAGLLWLLLMLGFELAIGRSRGFGWDRIAAEFDPRQGGFMLFGLLLMGLAPMLGAWLRGPRRIQK